MEYTLLLFQSSILLRTVLLIVLVLTTYIILHELLHYISATLLGCKPKLALLSDGILRSIGFRIADECVEGRTKRIVVLYSPYILNASVIAYYSLYHPSSLFIAVFTLVSSIMMAGLIFEDEVTRNRIQDFIGYYKKVNSYVLRKTIFYLQRKWFSSNTAKQLVLGQESPLEEACL